MNLETLNQIIESAYQDALLNPQRVLVQEIMPNVTLQTDIYTAPNGSGFRIVCNISIPEANLTITKVRNHGPDISSEKDWPKEGIENAIKNHIKKCIENGANHVIRYGFDADKKIILLNKFLKIKESNNLTNYPKLTALYEWMEEIQNLAINGKIYFPKAPFSFEEVISE